MEQAIVSDIDRQEQGITGQTEESSTSAGFDKEIHHVVEGFGRFGTSLSSFWGNVKKQSTEAYNAGRKELETRSAPLVTLAKDELAKTREELAKMSEQLKQQAQSSSTQEPPIVSAYGEIIQTPPTEHPPGTSPSVHPAEFLHKIQSQLATNPNLASLQRNVQEALHKLPPGIQAGSKQAEAYLSKATKDLERYFHQAVQIVPPSDPEPSEPRPSTSSSQITTTLSRKDALIAKLQANPSILLVDPALPPANPGGAATADTFQPQADSREPYAAFVRSIQAAGGFDTDAFQARIQAALSAPNATIKESFSQLVPEQLSAETFWTRYFFRVGQIEDEEERRQRVIQSALLFLDCTKCPEVEPAGAVETAEDDFSWENDEEDAASPRVAPSPAPAETPKPISIPSSAAPPSVASEDTDAWSPIEEKAEPNPPASNRNSSEAGTSSSYDVVTGLSSRAPSDAEGGVSKLARASKPATAPKDDGEDSDWE